MGHGLIEEAIRRHALKARVVRAARVIVNQGKVILDREQRLSPMPRSAKHFLTIPGLRPLDRWVREDPIAGNSWTK